MKKIMFDDKFGLTKAVLEGRKTMTRRLPDKNWRCVMSGIAGRDLSKVSTPYKVGEVVAVAQSYKSLNEMGYIAPEWCAHSCEDEENPAYNNKMFVLAELMPHQVRITNVRVERLRDITRGDIEKEGIQWSHKAHRYYTCFNPITATYLWLKGSTPEEAFAALIDKISGKGTWERNPWVLVYEFELVK